ncbi:molybdopterin-dependent oxidoreductase [Thalassobius sp. S69A]|uniref:molybdopterin-dependent oxidoreductase n=1 Tax=unclassified Thalassovita TaxID=2619711 RepID=UPI000C0CE303|nr:oxidoreductase [Paracoccaceae bacterium]MBT26527.1 oxidoreductase [Paracoccaceae bacterium]
MLPPLFRPLRPLALGAALTLSLAQVALAELATPEGKVVLTVSGTISETNAGDTAQFDMAMLRALPAQEITTSTIWTAGDQTFVGVALKDLAQAVGAEGAILRSYAINDYSVDIPASDAIEGGPIIAYQLNGAAMSVRDKGPLWIVYPYDSASSYRTEVIYSRSIWQLDRIQITD